jgi:hypothetical protein
MTAPVGKAHLEASLEAFFYRRVRLLGGHCIKLAPTERGVPDRLVLLPGGRKYLVELKREGGSLSAIQIAWHGRMKSLGHEVVVLEGKEQIIQWLRRTTEQWDIMQREQARAAARRTRKGGKAS